MDTLERILRDYNERTEAGYAKRSVSSVSSGDHDLTAIAMTIQRPRPELLRYSGDIHAGGLDGEWHCRCHCAKKARLWLSDDD